MPTPVFPAAEAGPPLSHANLRQLRKPNDDGDRVGSILARIADRINPVYYLNQPAKNTFVGDKFCGAPIDGGDWDTPTPTRIDPPLNEVEPTLGSEVGRELSHGYSSDKWSDGISRRAPSRFSSRPCKVMVKDTEFFVHKQIFDAMFPQPPRRRLDVEGCHTCIAADISEDAFEAALEYEYTQSIDPLEKLGDDDLDKLNHFAWNIGNMSLVAAICRVRKIGLLHPGNLDIVAEIYGWCKSSGPESLAYRENFRECLRKELPKRLEDGSSSDFVYLLNTALRDAGDAMKDVSMVLHELWSSKKTEAKPLEAELAAQDNVDNSSDNISWSRGTNCANDLPWIGNNQANLPPNNGWDDNVDAGVKSSSSAKISTTYRAASDLGPNAADLYGSSPPCYRPLATTPPNLQYTWGPPTSHHLNAPRFMPGPLPGPAYGFAYNAAPGGRGCLSQGAFSTLARDIHRWMTRQPVDRQSQGFEASEIAAGVRWGCTESGVINALIELVGARLIESYSPVQKCTSTARYIHHWMTQLGKHDPLLMFKGPEVAAQVHFTGLQTMAALEELDRVGLVSKYKNLAGEQMYRAIPSKTKYTVA